MLATPHLGYVTEANYRAYFTGAVEDIAAWQAGHPIRGWADAGGWPIWRVGTGPVVLPLETRDRRLSCRISSSTEGSAEADVLRRCQSRAPVARAGPTP